MNPMIPPQDAAGVYGLLALIKDPDATQKRLDELLVREKQIADAKKVADEASAKAARDTALANDAIERAKAAQANSIAAAADVASAKQDLERKNAETAQTLARRSAEMDARSAELDGRAASLASAADALAGKREEVEAREAALAQKEQSLVARINAAETARKNYELLRSNMLAALK